MRHSRYTVRGSLVKYIFCSCVLFIFIQALVYKASEEGEIASYICWGLLFIIFLLMIVIWRKWKLMYDPKVGIKFDADNLEHKEGFDIKTLSQWYMNPLEKVFPSAPPKPPSSKKGDISTS